MSGISNTEYIAVNAQGVWVGGQRTERYRGQNIYCSSFVTTLFFPKLQQLCPQIVEVDVMSSKTAGKRWEIGNPVPVRGRYAWCRFKYADGSFGPWVCCGEYRRFECAADYDADDCAAKCLYHCMHDVIGLGGLRSVLLTKSNVLSGLVGKDYGAR